MHTVAKSKPTMPEVAGAEHTYVELSDGRMHVASMGQGDPVLLLSGFAQTWWEWRELMPALAKAGFRALAIDLRGEGWSDLPHQALTRTRRAADIVELLDALDVPSAHLVSHDMGSISAFQLGLEHPARVRRQVLLAVPPPQMRFSLDMLPGMRHLWHQEVLSIPLLGPALLRSGPLPQWLLTHFAARPWDSDVFDFYLALLRDPELSRAAALLCRRMVLPELARITRGAYRQQRFQTPTLFCFGTRDVGFPPRVTRKVFADTQPYGQDVHLALIDGVGHYIMDEDPQASTRVIMDFLLEA